MLSLIAALMAPLSAQRTFHLYVDPIHGDDATALAANPTGATTPGAARPLQRHPGAPLQILGELQHAPYPFRTVTAAVAWVNSLPLNTGGTPLPYTNPDTEEVVDAVIIHCMPGLYGPRDPSAPAGDDDFDAGSGLPWNGETFPITLPGRVSLQGTSALDTIFDARDYALSTGSNLIVFDRSAGNEPAGAYEESFVDSLGLRGCRYRGSLSGAAIRFAAAGDVQPSISNCFVYANDVGILIDNPDPTTWNPHRPKIVNNTIAWNQIGIYSSAIAIEELVGYARPIVLNNLIDPIRFGTNQIPSDAPYLGGIGAGTSESPSCFEGLDETDLRAWVVGINPPQHHNYNGYHDSLRNLGNAWPYGVTAPRTTNPLMAPVVDLALLHGPWTGTRDTALFVSDVIAVTGAIPGGIRSDLRLAPMTWSYQFSWSPNPAVNWGISTAAGPIQCANGSMLTAPPGRSGDDLATFHAWDWDCEGFGNPRQASRRLGTGSHFAEPWGSSGKIDLGADEMGELIVAGYNESTRIFSRPHTSIAPNTASVSGSQLYFFNVQWPSSPTTTTYVGPQFNARFDANAFTAPTGAAEWYAQLGPYHNPFNPTGAAFAYTDGQYTAAGPFTNRYYLTGPAAVFPTRPHAPLPYFGRHRVCDIGPHLADDIDVPSWGSTRDLDYAEFDFSVTWQSPPPAVRDIFQANCWFETTAGQADPAKNDNRHLYIDGQGQRLRHGTLSPPLVLANEELQTAFPKSYLYRSATHPIGSWLPSPYTYDVLVTGMSAAMPQLPYVSTAPWYGVRINLELFQPDDPLWASLGSPVNNVQTFLVVEGPAEAQQRSSTPPSDLLLQSRSERAAAIYETERAMADLARENNR